MANRILQQAIKDLEEMRKRSGAANIIGQTLDGLYENDPDVSNQDAAAFFNTIGSLANNLAFNFLNGATQQKPSISLPHFNGGLREVGKGE